MARRDAISLALFSMILAAVADPAAAQGVDPVQTQSIRVGESGLPLPRFASLKSSPINMRIGPGTEHAIQWRYLKAGLPMEIVLEYDNWRKVRDADGAEGWVYHSMLSGKRTAIVEPWAATKVDDITAMIEAKSAEPVETIPVFARPDGESSVVALVEPGVVAELYECDGTWCAAKTGDRKGWIEQKRLWGVYPGEIVKD